MRTTTHDDHVVVELDRPARRNSIDLAAWRGLREAVEAAEANPAMRAVVVRGDSRSFCAGNDIDAMRSLDGAAEARAYFVDGMLPTFEAIARSPLPVISVVEGAALGGGVEIVTWSDIVIAGSGATFGLPETRIGVWATVYLGAMPYASSRRLGARLALVGEPIDHQEAKALGLATYAVDAADVDATLERVLAGISAGGRDAVARSKRWLNRELVDAGVEDSARALAELADETLQSAEYDASMAAFLRARAERAAARTSS